MSKGFTGISFPFRFSPKGGVTKTTTSLIDNTHIRESISQIIRTQLGERPMEYDFGTNSLSFLYEPLDGDTTILSIAKFSILKSLERWEKRITVDDVVIQPDSTTGSLAILVMYTIIQTQISDTTSIIIKTN